MISENDSFHNFSLFVLRASSLCRTQGPRSSPSVERSKRADKEPPRSRTTSTCRGSSRYTTTYHKRGDFRLLWEDWGRFVNMPSGHFAYSYDCSSLIIVILPSLNIMPFSFLHTFCCVYVVLCNTDIIFFTLAVDISISICH